MHICVNACRDQRHICVHACGDQRSTLGAMSLESSKPSFLPFSFLYFLFWASLLLRLWACWSAPLARDPHESLLPYRWVYKRVCSMQLFPNMCTSDQGRVSILLWQMYLSHLPRPHLLLQKWMCCWVASTLYLGASIHDWMYALPVFSCLPCCLWFWGLFPLLTRNFMRLLHDYVNIVLFSWFSFVLMSRKLLPHPLCFLLRDV